MLIIYPKNNRRFLVLSFIAILELCLLGTEANGEVEWWKTWPTYVDISAPGQIETAFRSHASTVTVLTSDEGRGAYYRNETQRLVSPFYTILKNNGVRTLVWLEGMGMGRATLGAVNEISNGVYEIDDRTGEPRLVGQNSIWDADGHGGLNPDATLGVWMGVHSWADRFSWQGSLVAPVNGTDSYLDPTYPNGSSALDSGVVTNPSTSTVWDAMGSKDINGVLWLTPRPVSGASNNTDRVYIQGTLVGDVQIGKDMAAVWWNDYNRRAARSSIDIGHDGFWVDNYEGFDFLGINPVKTAFGNWSIAGFRDYLQANSISVPAGYSVSTFDIAQYLKDVSGTSDVSSSVWYDPAWLNDAMWNAFKAYKISVIIDRAEAFYDEVKAEAVGAGRTDEVYVGGNDVGRLNFTTLLGNDLDAANVEYAPAGFNPITRDSSSRTERVPPYGHAGPFYNLITNYGETTSNIATVWYYMNGLTNVNGFNYKDDGYLGEVIGFEALAHNTTINTGNSAASNNSPGNIYSARKVNDVIANLGALFGERKPRAGIALFYSEDTEVADLTPGGYVKPIGAYAQDVEHTLGYFGWGEALEDLHVTYRTIVLSKLTSTNLASVSVLVLPHVRSMSQANVNIIKQFVSNGGWLVITGTDSGSITDAAGRFADNGSALLWDLTTDPSVGRR